MNVLRAGCEITPKQFLILQDIFRSQIDEDSSQNELDQLSAELDALNQQKINITIEGLEAALPYLNENEAIYARQLLEGFRKG
jgi:ABC-type transporter Mla subunit MlaD